MNGTQLAHGGGGSTRASQSSPLTEVLHGFSFPAPPRFVTPTTVTNTECPPKHLFRYPLIRVIPFILLEARLPEWPGPRFWIDDTGRALAQQVHSTQPWSWCWTGVGTHLHTADSQCRNPPGPGTAVSPSEVPTPASHHVLVSEKV